ncbi:MAG TPA: c-type cytochrome biogenesis protein CcmI [Solimonas sp.]|nr:c-type cytochrome biogenesis protein CcmI [Solimonas sp.]
MSAYLGMAAVLLLAAVWLTRPFWSRSGVAQLRRKAANVAVYRSRLAELENEAASGLVEAEAATQLRQELAARLLRDAETPAEASEPAVAPRRAWQPALLLSVLLAGFAVAAYWQQGSWRTQQMVAVAAQNPEAGRQLAVEDMVAKLAARLEKSPDDIEGWAMLGRSYAVLGRYNDAATAYGEANRRVPQPDADLLVSEGEALAMARERDLMGRPQQLFQQALAIDADHGKALWYAGLAASQAQDYAAARDHWLRLSQRQDLPEELRTALAERLQQLAQLAGQPAPAMPLPTAAPAAAKGETRLKLKVSLSPELVARAPPGATLFVFAKAEQGPPMPLAVQKLPGAKLPLEISLDDSMGMMPQLKLSQFDNWVVTARITAGGSVKAEPGDWEGSRKVSRVESAQPVALVIDRVVP